MSCDNKFQLTIDVKFTCRFKSNLSHTYEKIGAETSLDNRRD